jgi:hypothetical protein
VRQIVVYEHVEVSVVGGKDKEKKMSWCHFCPISADISGDLPEK